MSTDFHIACEKCRECYWVGQLGMRMFSFYSGEPQCMKGIGPFIEKHVLCGGGGPRLLAEQFVDDFTEVEWPSAA